ncbi:hypothetical protein [Gloeothece verrucosa]|uniref:Uncharacterized protein n=1 Tax=Gloeothece verrucosa (strain PCC 7822) TaxID=497965 RepID=E0UMF4_GLOV7|nr:hypothetical protein [Gloeothece verrucosa]ADN18134.1 conserved hypothetical protein [Gloeothece verrucosa PCC 7822]
MQIDIHGQTINLPDELTDEQIRAAFAPYYPEIATAELKRDGQTVKVIKRAGTKGSNLSVAKALFTASPYINPALLLSLKIRNAEMAGLLSLETLLALQDEINLAISDSREAEEMMRRMKNNLISSRPISDNFSNFI